MYVRASAGMPGLNHCAFWPSLRFLLGVFWFGLNRNLYSISPLREPSATIYPTSGTPLHPLRHVPVPSTSISCMFHSQTLVLPLTHALLSPQWIPGPKSLGPLGCLLYLMAMKRTPAVELIHQKEKILVQYQILDNFHPKPISEFSFFFSPSSKKDEVKINLKLNSGRIPFCPRLARTHPQCNFKHLL